MCGCGPPSTDRAPACRRSWRGRRPRPRPARRPGRGGRRPFAPARSPASRRALRRSRPWPWRPASSASLVLLVRRSWGSGRDLRAGLALLEDPDRVAERIADAHVRAVEVVGGLLREVGYAPLLERLVQGARVVGDEDEAAYGALRDELADLRRRRLVVQRGAG